jgi:type II secretory pathway component PulJ
MIIKKKEAGFTTVELLVALQIAFLVAGFVYAAYLMASRLAGIGGKKLIWKARPRCACIL